MTKRAINKHSFWPDDPAQEEKRKEDLEKCVKREDGVTVCPPAYAWGYRWEDLKSGGIL